MGHESRIETNGEASAVTMHGLLRFHAHVFEWLRRGPALTIELRFNDSLHLLRAWQEFSTQEFCNI